MALTLGGMLVFILYRLVVHSTCETEKLEINTTGEVAIE